MGTYYELAKRMTRLDNGARYRGFEFAANIQIQYNQMSLPATDCETVAAAFNTDSWKSWFTSMTCVYAVHLRGEYALIQGWRMKYAE